jgi:hypothetical protein
VLTADEKVSKGLVFRFWFSFWLLASFAFCTLAGKDAGPNNTKMLRGPNAE